MQVNVEKFLADAGIDEKFYPGKRIVKQCRQSGDHKSHCVVLDWRDPEKIRIEVKPGLSGRDLVVEKVKKYPVSFQTPTFVEIEVVNDNDDEEDEETGKASGKKGGGSKGQKLGKENGGLMAAAFASLAEGVIPDLGEIKQMVVMGTEIAAEAFESVFNKLTDQISKAKIGATDLLAQAGKFITKYTPPAFMEPTGNEDASYKYDAEKNADIGYSSPGLG